MEMTGKIVYVNNTKTPSDSKPDFKTREFGLDTSVEMNGQRYESYCGLQVAGADKCAMLDNIKIGDEVTVQFAIKGFKKDKTTEVNTSPQNPNNTVIYTNLNAYSVVVTKAAGEAIASGANTASSNTASGANASSNVATNACDDDLPF